MAYANAAKHAMLNELATLGVFTSLHSADPGTTGASEVTGGAPAYARQGVAWDAAAAGAISLTGTELFDVPASTVAFFGVWSAVSAGTFYGGGALSASEIFAAQGTYELTEATLDLNL